MSLYGVRAFPPLLENTPDLLTPSMETLELPQTEILQVMFEIDDGPMLELLPPALHPTLPPSVTFLFWRCSDGPLGPFSLAQVRLGCRAGTRGRGLPLASYCDSETATRALRERWGYNCRPGIVRLRRGYDRIAASVMVADDLVLQVSLLDPRVISGSDVQYTANLNLARMLVEGVLTPRLVQVDPEYTFHRAERGRPAVEGFVAEAWSAAGVRPAWPVSASFSRCDIVLPRIRFVTDPDVPALEGTAKLG